MIPSLLPFADQAPSDRDPASADRPGTDPFATGDSPAVTSTIALLFAALISGCATGFVGSDVEDFGTFRIDVTNDVSPRVEIRLVEVPGDGSAPGAGPESPRGNGELLGPAPVEGTTTFRIDVQDPAGSYRLRAVLPRNRELLSDPFVPVDNPAIHWILDENSLGPLEPEPDQDPDQYLEADAERSYRGPAGVRRPTGGRLIPPE